LIQDERGLGLHPSTDICTDGFGGGPEARRGTGSSAQLEAAQANLNVASKELERQKQLFQKQYISQGALDLAQAQWEAARAQVQAQQAQTRAAQTQTGFFSVRAPFNGVVSDVAVTLGDMAMPGRPMLTLHDPWLCA
jgi:multidrug resistance efflux pump